MRTKVGKIMEKEFTFEFQVISEEQKEVAVTGEFQVHPVNSLLNPLPLSPSLIPILSNLTPPFSKL